MKNKKKTLKGIRYQLREKSLKRGLHFLFTVALLLQASASKRGCDRAIDIILFLFFCK